MVRHAHVSRNPQLARGVPKFSRSSQFHKTGRWANKARGPQKKKKKNKKLQNLFLLEREQELLKRKQQDIFTLLQNLKLHFTQKLENLTINQLD